MFSKFLVLLAFVQVLTGLPIEDQLSLPSGTVARVYRQATITPMVIEGGTASQASSNNKTAKQEIEEHSTDSSDGETVKATIPKELEHNPDPMQTPDDLHTDASALDWWWWKPRSYNFWQTRINPWHYRSSYSYWPRFSLWW